MSITLHRFGKTAIAMLAVLFVTYFGAGAAHAADTWTPQFDPARHVYVDPALVNHPTQPFNLDAGFAAELSRLGQKHGLDIYVVAAQKGDDVTGDRKRWAPEFLHSHLWSTWSGRPGFNEDRSVVILWLRSPDASSMSTAARVGGLLHGYGVTRQRLNAQDGPVMQAIRAHMPGNPAGCFLSIAENINAEVDRYLASHTRSQAPAAPQAPQSGESSNSGTAVLIFVLIAAGVVAAIIVIASARARRREEERQREFRRTYTSPETAARRTTPAAPTTGRDPGEARASGEGNNTAANAAALGAAALGGAALGHVLTRDNKKKDEPRRDDSTSSSSGSDSTPYVAGCSSGSSGGDSGGGGSCGGGGCGGGGCGGGGCGGS